MISLNFVKRFYSNLVQLLIFFKGPIHTNIDKEKGIIDMAVKLIFLPMFAAHPYATFVLRTPTPSPPPRNKTHILNKEMVLIFAHCFILYTLKVRKLDQ